MPRRRRPQRLRARSHHDHIVLISLCKKKKNLLPTYVGGGRRLCLSAISVVFARHCRTAQPVANNAVHPISTW